ncbi:putative inactive receptor kinase [Frankliniella fusca]|uniref:Inactive receptor kinase n=1 Tax=Frankliniella fusca TaxID=407009 RepID=A0AAE1HSD5_9NEOP|nr:putative inactive receptor kinase [Frankliniella fusca]KAK3925359.1 putative inactive receptor kinase [Frankliniella fusca]KAK3926604.1 putative inactive receptor kinase [Frankliniella fusca]KAK3930569.1 putative inactive receptor kinase [Frankliniella fusca]KAK3931708.1 putative inactive receptor kinase [Frankliniella fusca]
MVCYKCGRHVCHHTFWACMCHANDMCVSYMCRADFTHIHALRIKGIL